jgi:hypothetical protein
LLSTLRVLPEVESWFPMGSASATLEKD